MLNNIDNYETVLEFIKTNRKNIKDVIHRPWYSTTCMIDRNFVLIDLDNGFTRIHNIDSGESTGYIYMSGKNLQSIADWIRF